MRALSSIPVRSARASTVASPPLRARRISLLTGLFIALRYLTWYSLVSSIESPMVWESLSDNFTEKDLAEGL